MSNDLNSHYVVLIEDRGYLQSGRKVGEKETARTFTSSTEALQAGMRYMNARRKQGAVHAVRLDDSLSGIKVLDNQQEKR